jgi:hypothetical protein
MTHTDPPARKTPGGHAASHSHDPSQHHYTAEELHNEDVAHEHSDISIRSVTMYAVALAVITATAFGLMYGLFRFLESQAAGNDARLSPLAVPAVQMPPNTTESPTFGNAPQPQLLTSEPTVLGQQRRYEDLQLTAYGWVDEARGVARIPIAEAKKLIVERGLPARADGAADPTLGTVRPSKGEASGGRTVNGPPRGAGLPDVGGK